jgi:phosphoribosylaminoimidazolecarboxamide formyltransferase/IMP cyclohydrolase
VLCAFVPQGLAAAGYELVSTGGSAKAIEASGVAVKKVEDLTGFPEMLDGEQQLLEFQQKQQ